MAKKKKKNEILEEAEAAEELKRKKKKKKKKKEKKAKKVRVAELVEDDAPEDEQSKRKEALDKVGELLDHPLVADVVAAGAVAAVAALAENKATQARGTKTGSRTMLKMAGAAAAAAIGKRLKAEYDAMKPEDEDDEG
ncbi:hypothetical protein [Sphingomicrobium clamense]|uniref:Uncharacterized protein n=1 Tax=Sphingomicrobium clamense TaxID=2851013 RepID=A0ABS6V4X9_9SPHN|nr:hypothetical protein [Sphingomicrobium sp. B8]MBW0144617.1 hypothetical protein [Sphingomicrobium sp. B8]